MTDFLQIMYTFWVSVIVRTLSTCSTSEVSGTVDECGQEGYCRHSFSYLDNNIKTKWRVEFISDF